MKLPRTAIRRHLREGHKGQALVEFAVVALVFMMFVCAILDGARLFQSWVTVQHAAREGARYAITGQTTCVGGGTQTRSACTISTAKGKTSGMASGGATSTAVSVSCRRWDYGNATWTDASVTTLASPCTDAGLGDQCDAVEVRVNVTHRFVTPILSAIKPAGIALTGTQRMINEPFGNCNL